MDPFEVQLESGAQGLPATHPEHADTDTWVSISRGESSDDVIQKLMGDGIAVLVHDYADASVERWI